jgi:hypothetical protein
MLHLAIVDDGHGFKSAVRHYYTYEDANAFGDIYSPAMPATYGVAVERKF